MVYVCTKHRLGLECLLGVSSLGRSRMSLVEQGSRPWGSQLEERGVERPKPTRLEPQKNLGLQQSNCRNS